MSKTLLKTEARMNRSEIAERIRTIADRLEEGTIELSSATDSVELHPPETAELEIKVEEESDGELSLEIEVEWNPSKTSDEIEIG